MTENTVSSSRPEEMVGQALLLGGFVTLIKLAYHAAAQDQDVWDSVGDSLLAGSTAAAGSFYGMAVYDEMLAAGHDESSAKLAGVGAGLTAKVGLRAVIDQAGKSVADSQAAAIPDEVQPQMG